MPKFFKNKEGSTKTDRKAAGPLIHFLPGPNGEQATVMQAPFHQVSVEIASTEDDVIAEVFIALAMFVTKDGGFYVGMTPDDAEHLADVLRMSSAQARGIISRGGLSEEEKASLEEIE